MLVLSCRFGLSRGTQILFTNMVTSSPPALGLACEPAEQDVMQVRTW